jgi:hypothetical protein
MSDKVDGCAISSCLEESTLSSQANTIVCVQKHDGRPMFLIITMFVNLGLFGHFETTTNIRT